MRSNSTTKPGGAAMLNGVAYQMLASLFTAFGAEVSKVEGVQNDKKPSSATLILEPSDGGDQQLESGDRWVVEQIKARSTRKPWGLRELIHEVLPDLYRAARSGKPIVEYRFVSEVGFGKWRAEWQQLFAALEEAPTAGSSPDLLLDDQRRLAFLAGAPGLRKQMEARDLKLTERGLFRFMTEELRSSPAVARAETLEETLCNLASLLRIGIRFRPLNRGELLAEILRQLGSRGVPESSALTTADAMCFELLRLGAAGDAEVDLLKLLRQHGVSELSLSDWGLLRRRNRHQIERKLQVRGYRVETDARSENPLMSFWSRSTDLAGPEIISSGLSNGTVIHGRSGTGKSWCLYRLALELVRAPQDDGPICLLVESKDSLRDDLQQAAEQFCDELWDIPRPFSLERLAREVESHCPGRRGRPWLVLLLDGISDSRYLEELARTDLANRGVQLGVALTTAAGDEAARAPHGLHCLPQSSFELRTSEVLQWLQRTLGPSAQLPPADVVELLRRLPLLIRLYQEAAAGRPAWSPQNEYAVMESYWTRVSERIPVAAGVLSRLAADAISSATNPTLSFIPAHLHQERLSEDDLKALEGSGLLSVSPSGRERRFWHDRVGQWAVAEGLARSYDARLLPLDELRSRFVSLLDPDAPRARWFGYVPLDLLWLLADPARNLGEAVRGLLAELEERDALFSQLHTLGDRVVPFIFDRLRAITDASSITKYRYREVLRKLAGTVSFHARQLLAESSLDLQRTAVSLLAEKQHADAEALDRLWELHRVWDHARREARVPSCEAERDRPTTHDWVASDKALGNCVQGQTAWLERAILAADPDQDPVHTLVYLIPKVGEAEAEALWHRIKDVCFEKVHSEHERCFAVGLLYFNDRSRPDWLVERANADYDVLGPMARNALAHLHPELALKPIPPADELRGSFELYLARSWWLPPLWIFQPAQTEQMLFEHITRAEDPWLAAMILSGHENRTSPRLADFLLDETERLLATRLTEPREEGEKPLYRAFQFLARLNRLELLQRFWARRGSGLERHLTDWLIERGPEDRPYVDHLARNGQRVLSKISGAGVSELARFYIRHGTTHFGRRAGFSLAYRAHDRETTDVLRVALTKDQLEELAGGKPFPLDQREALLALAVAGEDLLAVLGVVRWGLDIPRDFHEYLESRTWSDAILQPALEALSLPEPPPGSLLALGFSGRHEFATRLHAVLRTATPGTRTALACLVALEALGDTSEESELAFAAALEHQKTHFVGWRALLRMGTASAEDRLLERLRAGDEENLLGVYLLLRSRTRRRAAEILWAREHDPWFHHNLGEEIEHLAELRTPEVFAFLEKLAFERYPSPWGGSTFAGIHGLARHDAPLAFEAARRLLGDPERRSRFDVPELLLDLDRERALPLLEELIRDEDEMLVLLGVGEALVRSEAGGMIREWLVSADERVRQGGAIASRVLPWSRELEERLLACCRDRAWDVREAAIRTLRTLRDEHEVRAIIARLRVEQDLARRWSLLEAAVELGYPGVTAGFGRYTWFSDLCQGLPHVMRKHASERLEKRREELVKELAKKKRTE